jgi:hypothetical protein
MTAAVAAMAARARAVAARVGAVAVAAAAMAEARAVLAVAAAAMAEARAVLAAAPVARAATAATEAMAAVAAATAAAAALVRRNTSRRFEYLSRCRSHRSHPCLRGRRLCLACTASSLPCTTGNQVRRHRM